MSSETLAELLSLYEGNRLSQAMTGVGDFTAVCAFVSGVAFADQSALLGFRQHLLARLGQDSNLTFSGIVLEIGGYLEGDRAVLGDNPNDHRRAIEILFSELRNFHDRQQHSE